MDLIGDEEKNAPSGSPLGGVLRRCQPLVDRLFAESNASSWGLPSSEFAAALAHSASKSLTAEVLATHKLDQYLAEIHVRDLALACACARGSTSAWDHFVAAYQNYLRGAAAAILRCPATSPEARDLADSLFADLYGLTEGKSATRSLFRYYHGRSSLKTWLRAVLAQRHIDAIRAGRRFTDLEDGEQTSPAISPHAARTAALAPMQDPHRQRYLALFRAALQGALAALDPRDQNRLRLYYAENQTLAEIGRNFGEHESSVSRNLDRTRRDLRQQVEQALLHGCATKNGSSEPGLSAAQIALCFEYAAEDAPIDFDTLFPAAGASPAKTKSTVSRPQIAPRKGDQP